MFFLKDILHPHGLCELYTFKTMQKRRIKYHVFVKNLLYNGLVCTIKKRNVNHSLSIFRDI